MLLDLSFVTVYLSIIEQDNSATMTMKLLPFGWYLRKLVGVRIYRIDVSPPENILVVLWGMLDGYLFYLRQLLLW